MTHPDVVVVGAGVVGASCAAHLARAGLRVVVVERAPVPGAGSTARATGGFRAQFATAMNVRLSLLARAQLARFRDDTGVDPGFAPVGYLWLAATDAELAALRTAQAVQHAAGLTEARMVDADAIRAIQPAASLAGVSGGAWCPTDGTLRPMELVRGYLALAERHGADVRWGEPVVELERAGDRIAAVVTPRSRLATPLVVNAAGVWASEVGRLAGVDVPVTPMRSQVAVTVPTPALPPSMPLTIWLGDGFHARVRDDRVLLLLPRTSDAADLWSERADPAWLDAMAAMAPARFPPLAGVPFDRDAAWAGLYEMSPDHHVLLGPAAACPELFLVNGSSGHGVMHAPAVGLLAAEMITGAAPSLDVHALRPSRFAEGEPIAGGDLF